MRFRTINPATEEGIAEYETATKEEIAEAVKNARAAFLKWKSFGIDERAPYFRNLAEILREKKEKYARLITMEMGKPIKQAMGEVEKCAWTAEVYAENAQKWLEDETVQADGKKHLVAFEPLGVILSIMPWNFPFWQAFRFAIPTLIAGNVSILKHSNTVPQCAFAIEEAFMEAGFQEGMFKALLMEHESAAELIRSDDIHGVSLTGSVSAGARVAEAAGKHFKKFVLELGGSDPFIVLEDADIEAAARNAAAGRMMNSGQSCIAAKRFIVMHKVAREFSEKFADAMSKIVVGNPLDEKTEAGPLVNEQQLLQIEAQVKDATHKGAQILTGGARMGNKGYFYKPTVLSKVTKEMKVMKEEVFGPVAPVIAVKSEGEAIAVANDSEYGLGASIWTKDYDKAMMMSRQLEAGDVFVNSIVKSDPRMPFGGIKKSGIGRELSKYGLREFVNIKGINIY